MHSYLSLLAPLLGELLVLLAAATLGFVVVPFAPALGAVPGFGENRLGHAAD